MLQKWPIMAKAMAQIITLRPIRNWAMALSDNDIHTKKRRKNLVLLALIFGWCALIWAITVVRMGGG
jgi:hypothetical protein